MIVDDHRAFRSICRLTRRQVCRVLRGLLLPVILLPGVCASDDGQPKTSGTAEASAAQTIDFSQHVQPILNKHCVACHGGVKQAGEVSFVYRDQVLPPDGWIVEPGDPDASILLQRVLETDLELRMPPPEHGAALSAEDVSVLRQWIAQGAVWEGGHWAYTRPQMPKIPAVKDVLWTRNPIDAFVLKRLEDSGLTPSASAEPVRWLRRVTLDLTGLPPTLSDRHEFLTAVAVDESAAREAVVDRLLADPAFGERWASVWLDQVRYADSRGLGADGRRTIWKYRDWVIAALNADMPFDEFTIKQIAGDLLPAPTIEDLLATAAHRVTQTNEEGGTDDEEFRVAAVVDRVNTTWQAWQGVTFGCVQCHSHPYDPFRHEEYYQFAAFFNNTQDVDLNEDWPVLKTPLNVADYEKASALQSRLQQQQQALWEAEYPFLNTPDHWQKVADLQASTNNRTRITVEQVDGEPQFHTIDTVSRNTDITLSASVPNSMEQLTAVRLTAMPLDPKTAVRDSEWGFVLSHVQVQWIDDTGNAVELPVSRLVIDEPAPFYNPQDSLNPKSNRGFAAYTRIHYPRQAALVLKQPFEVPDTGRLQVVLKHRVHILASFSLITRRGALAVSADSAFTDLLSDESILALRADVAATQKQIGAIKSVAIPVLAERPRHLQRPTHVFERGLFLTKAQKVQAGTPQSLPPLPSLPEGQAPSRLQLAQWLASEDNPLTARVMVNRLWARLFGTGLVATEEDFGSSGEPPSHPQLLDYLAVKFQTRDQWRLKAALKEIVLSATYGQTAKATAQAWQNDPANRLLARGPRFRLSSEMVRDQALAVSGLLSRKMNGPPVHPPIPAGVWKPFQGGDKWPVPKPDNEDRYRRSIYTYTKRSIPYPMFAAFDAPSREFCTPRRLRSNTPLQALMMLNDQTLEECAAALAEQMLSVKGSLRQQVRHGFLQVTLREPDDAEIADLLKLHDVVSSGDEDGVDRGMQAVARLLLNLDEVLMK
ncbi:MAG: PSD1 and planctomycete cytochrome C domain-containing protein [Planctomycetaceae bacterium]|nr:PSD1 and planctomycete cytochrome C domain-containing protein [Planctomycetaceae bacterium]